MQDEVEQTEDVFAPGGMYDTDLVTFADCARCFFFGHDVRSWGTLFGWCHRCKHSVHSYDRRRVLHRGEYHWFPPKHTHNPTRRPL